MSDDADPTNPTCQVPTCGKTATGPVFPSTAHAREAVMAAGEGVNPTNVSTYGEPPDGYSWDSVYLERDGEE